MGIGKALISMISSHVVCSFDKFSDKSGNIETWTSAVVDALRTVELLRDLNDVCLRNVFVSVDVRILLIVAARHVIINDVN